MKRTTTRHDAEIQFWNDVEELLKGEHQHSQQDARRGVDEYRAETGVKCGDVIYNQGEERTAEIIDERLDAQTASGSDDVGREGLVRW